MTLIPASVPDPTVRPDADQTDTSLAGSRSLPTRLRSLTRGLGGSIWPATIALFLISPFIAHGSVSTSGLNTTLPFAAVLAIAALGETLVIQQRGLDLSVPATISLSAILISKLSASHSTVLALVIVAVVCVASGLVSGLAVTALRITPLIATLGVNAILTGTILWITNGSATATAPSSVVSFATDKLLGIPDLVVVAVALALVTAWVQRSTYAGRRFVTVGSNPAAAYVAGLAVKRTEVSAYVLASCCYGIAGIALAGYVGNPGLSPGDVYLLPAIAAVVLGGTSLAGGRGSLVGTAVAALFLTQLQQVAFGAGAPASVQQLIQGGVIAVGMGLRNIDLRGVLTRRRRS